MFTRFYEVVHLEEGARPELECGIYCAPYCLLLVSKEAACVSVAFCPCLLLQIQCMRIRPPLPLSDRFTKRRQLIPLEREEGER